MTIALPILIALAAEPSFVWPIDRTPTRTCAREAYLIVRVPETLPPFPLASVNVPKVKRMPPSPLPGARQEASYVEYQKRTEVNLRENKRRNQ